ncbi:hypothetical protein SZ54_0132 [Rhizobium sp. UR51a]|nr:hypothetical protein SZ54_0132 [Rhizobium sp. UR51a]
MAAGFDRGIGRHPAIKPAGRRGLPHFFVAKSSSADEPTHRLQESRARIDQWQNWGASVA